MSTLPAVLQGTVTGRFRRPVTTMSSREIAELTGKEHRTILFDVRKMLAELEIGEQDFLRSYQRLQNKAMPEFRLPKDLTITLVSGHSIPMRHRIVTRWMELEEATKPAAPVVASSDPLDLLLVQAQMFPKLIAEMQEQKRAQAGLLPGNVKKCVLRLFRLPGRGPVRALQTA